MWIYILAAILIIILASVAVIYHDTHNFTVRNYEVKTDKIDGDYTFVLLADLHGYVYGKNNERLIKAVTDTAPDAVLCAGDMFVARLQDGRLKMEAGDHVLKELAKRFPVYAANGNHEKKIKTFTKEFGNAFDRYKSALQRAGVIYLENESYVIEDKNIRITGLDLSRDYFQKVVKKQMDPGYLDGVIGEIKGAEQNMFQVLIAHNPQYFKEYAAWGADLTVSGHVHGGIIRLPFVGGIVSPTIALFPKYNGGKYMHDGRTMVLSRGLGTHTIHVRRFNPGEVSVRRIKGK